MGLGNRTAPQPSQPPAPPPAPPMPAAPVATAPVPLGHMPAPAVPLREVPAGGYDEPEPGDGKQVVMNNTNPGRLLHIIDSRPGRAPTDLVTLKPGANHIDVEIVEMMRKHNTVVQWIRLQYIRLPKPLKLGGFGLSNFSEPEAIEIVRETYDVDLLTRWLDTERRSDIREVMRDRRGELQRALSKEEGA